MALQLFKIASTTVESPVTEITFTSIPSGYTDLLILASVRDNRSSNAANDMTIRFNGSGTGYSWRRLYTDSGATIASNTSDTIAVIDSSTATSNTFASVSLYIPNYLSSNNKSLSSDSVQENNTTNAFLQITAGLWSNSSAITSIALAPANSASFVANSTATLYGIL
jgi:hypothetical protein